LWQLYSAQIAPAPTGLDSQWVIRDWKCKVPKKPITDSDVQIRAQNEQMISEYTGELRNEVKSLRTLFTQTFTLQLDIVSLQLDDIKSSIARTPEDVPNTNEIIDKIKQLETHLILLKEQLEEKK